MENLIESPVTKDNLSDVNIGYIFKTIHYDPHPYF